MTRAHTGQIPGAAGDRWVPAEVCPPSGPAAGGALDREEPPEAYRRLAGHISDLVEREKKAVARQIHDELGQVMTALKMDLVWLTERLPEADPRVADKLANMTRLVDRSIKSVKRISSELRPGILDDLGIGAAVRWQVESFQRRHGIRAAAVCQPEDPQLPEAQSVAVFRCLQEALANVAQHAAAGRVAVDLRVPGDGTAVLEVADNGRGMAAGAQERPGAYGILGMRERLCAVAGRLHITSTPGRGTVLRIEVPDGSRGPG